MTIPAQKTAWCFKCAKQQRFVITAAAEVLREGDKKHVATQYAARCAVCGQSVEVEWVDAINNKMRLEAIERDRRRSAVSNGQGTQAP